MRFFLYIIVLSILWTGCSIQEESISFDPNLEILFSNDSVTFDTLLSASRSHSHRLQVYNFNKQAIQLSRISLGLGDASDYSVVINGKETSSVINERILGGDSLLILVEVNIIPRNDNDPYLVKDSIVFEWNTNSAHVKLISYGQDGTKIQNQTVCDEMWTNNRPYIVSDTLLVETGCTLSIEKGTKVYFENDAVMLILGTLMAVGDSANHIEFRNARFDGVYDEVPGQWEGIYFLEGSVDNQIRFADIFNGRIGLRIGTPDDDDDADIQIANTKIYNMSLAGILAFTSDVEVSNTLIYNCGTFMVGNFAGGNYSYRHCTFSNEPSLFTQEEPGVQFSDNVIVGVDDIITADLNLELINCIIWGTADEELLINNRGGAYISALLVTNIIRSGEEIENNFVSRGTNFPGFKKMFSFDYSLDTLAFARDRGTNIGISDDLLGLQRDDLPDIGAYEFIEN